jgi:2-dehydro-3-deoxyphosphogalactonate aldolase
MHQSTNPTLIHYLEQMPLVAILRGITPEESLAVVNCLMTAGISIVEVPLNSPNPYESIGLISEKIGDRVLIGAGTVLNQDQVKELAKVGGRLVVSPNTNVGVIESAKALNMHCVPGAATPSEVFTALDAGADGVKAFPAEMLTPQIIKSWRAVLPKNVNVLPVGGISTANMRSYWQVGVNGFGIGGSLYQSGKSISAISASALAFVEEMKTLRQVAT